MNSDGRRTCSRPAAWRPHRQRRPRRLWTASAVFGASTMWVLRRALNTIDFTGHRDSRSGSKVIVREALLERRGLASMASQPLETP